MLDFLTRGQTGDAVLAIPYGLIFADDELGVVCEYRDTVKNGKHYGGSGYKYTELSCQRYLLMAFFLKLLQVGPFRWGRPGPGRV